MRPRFTRRIDLLLLKLLVSKTKNRTAQEHQQLRLNPGGFVRRELCSHVISPAHREVKNFDGPALD
jgi:hypothetical protein